MIAGEARYRGSMGEQEEQSTIQARDVALVEETHPGTEMCPTCGFNRWYIVQGPGTQVALLPTGESANGVLQGTGHPLVALTCQRCGYLKMHIKEMYDAYVRHLRDTRSDANGAV